MTDNKTPNDDIKQIMETYKLAHLEMAYILQYIEPCNVLISGNDIYNYANNRANPPADKYKKIMKMKEIDNFDLIMVEKIRWRLKN